MIPKNWQPFEVSPFKIVCYEELLCKSFNEGNLEQDDFKTNFNANMENKKPFK